MANLNFHGSYSTAHPLGDAGGDMVSMFEGDLQDISLSETWYCFNRPFTLFVLVFNRPYSVVARTRSPLSSEST